ARLRVDLPRGELDAVRDRLADVRAAREGRVDGDHERRVVLAGAAAAGEQEGERECARSGERRFQSAAVPRYAARTSGSAAPAAGGRPDAITAPAATTTTRSATERTSRRLCSTRRTPTPRSLNSETTRARIWTSSSELPADGSSSRSTRGRLASAAATPSSRCSGPDSSAAGRSTAQPSPTPSRTAPPTRFSSASSARASGVANVERAALA